IQTIEQKRANRQRWADAAIAVATFIGNAAGITIVLAVLGAVVTTIVKAIASARSVSVEQRPAAQARVMPEIQIVSPLPERQPYEPLDWIPPTGETLQQLHDRRLAERMQEVTQQKEADLFEARMRALSDPARISREQYHRFPNAG
ncbi:MAG TPA: hypothetical protein PLF42_10330, partial [Anaerolineales bacterium]|nr:hypothetical protein [Anaerolineales bacterium]